MNHDSEIATQYAFMVGIPFDFYSVVSSLSSSIGNGGIGGYLKQYMDSSATNANANAMSNYYVTKTDEEWIISKYHNDNYGISPANEVTLERILSQLITKGKMLEFMSSIGKALQLKKLEGLALIHFSYGMASSYHSNNVYHEEEEVLLPSGVYRLMIPLLGDDGGLPQDLPELMLVNDRGEKGGYVFYEGNGVLLGPNTRYWIKTRPTTNSEEEKTTRGSSSSMGFVANLYLADVTEENVADIAHHLASFPLMSEEWLRSQSGRFWRRNDEQRMLHGDLGRKSFRFRDELEDCPDRKQNGLCTTDLFETRKKCLKTCQVYIEEGPVSIRQLDNDQVVEVCTQNRTGNQHCQPFQDTDIPGHFITPQLGPGQLFPIAWRDTHTITTPYAFQIGFPPELISSLQSYCDRLGITSLFRELTHTNPIPPQDEHSGRFLTLGDGKKWYAQRPAKKWTSNMHWISPADETAHEEYLKVLAEGNFDLVLDAIGKYLGLSGLVAYHLTFIGVSHSEKGYIHHDSTDTAASVYNVIIPLILEEDASPELVMVDDADESRVGSLKYKIGMGALMGDDAMHGTEACDYREKKGMRLAATVYIADVNYNNAWDITSQTLTQIFPLPDARWLMTQAGRHWGDRTNSSLVNDQGRKWFKFYDKWLDCAERVANGECESGKTTDEAKVIREKCMLSCHVYDESLNVKSNGNKTRDQYSSTLDHFFDSIGDDPSCVDESEECPDLASKGMCMTDAEGLKQLGCRFSCMFCLSSKSRDIFSLGEEQSFTEEGRESEELPTQEDISAVLAETETYMANEVLLYDDYEHVRVSCRNYYTECALWAAEGECDAEHGWMRKHCPAACRDCLGVDPEVRCPVDYDSNVVGPGDINKMFERWLEEAGQDVSSFSSTNLPKGGTHQYGELIVITSPYQYMMPLLHEEDKQFAHEYTPIPWVVAIENFLSDEECERLIELGGDEYERSTEYAPEMSVDGSYAFVESEGRTSTNTWCQDECREDPVTKAVIERMTNMTGIPYDNYEDLQLVRYEPGQFYQKHHDFADGHVDSQYGPRLLTFFLYLNDVEDGGGTQFEDLKFAAQPKRGMALVWPSVVNDNPMEKDDWTWHEALPVKKGVKYGANAWIHMRDYQNVPEYC